MQRFLTDFEPSKTASRSTPELERLFGVVGMTQGRKIAMRPLTGLLASDIPAREQIQIALKFIALGFVPPLVVGGLLLGSLWARGALGIN